MLTAIGRIRDYSRGLDLADLQRDVRTLDAVLRNLEVIGEAAKQIPVELRARASEIEWRKIAGMRDLIAHAHFDVDIGIVWDVVATKLGPLETACAGCEPADGVAKAGPTRSLPAVASRNLGGRY